MKPRLPEEVGPESQRLHYGEDFTSDRIQILQQARQIANKFSEMKNKKQKDSLTKTPVTVNVKSVIKCFTQKLISLVKTKKIAVKWTGPVLIMKIKDDVVIIKLASGKTKPININRLRKFWEQEILKRGRRHMLKIQTKNKRTRKWIKVMLRETLIKVWHQILELRV